MADWDSCTNQRLDSVSSPSYTPLDSIRRPFPRAGSGRRRSTFTPPRKDPGRGDATAVVGLPKHGSGVRGRLEAIDDCENLVHPVVRDEVDRPRTTKVRVRTE